MERYEGFTEFVLARTPALARTAYLLTGDHQLAEDLLQAAFAKTARQWPRVRDRHPDAYVRRVLYTEQVTRWRRRRVVERPSEVLPDRGHGDPADATALRLTLGAALDRLTARQRAVVVLRYYEDLTEAQAAQVLGCAVGTVKSQTSDALARLRRLAPELAVELGSVRQEVPR